MYVSSCSLEIAIPRNLKVDAKIFQIQAGQCFLVGFNREPTKFRTVAMNPLRSQIEYLIPQIYGLSQSRKVFVGSAPFWCNGCFKNQQGGSSKVNHLPGCSNVASRVNYWRRRGAAVPLQP